VFGIVDTNSDPTNIDFVIPANDDATKSVEVILDACCAAIAEGLEERKIEKLDQNEPAEEDEDNEEREESRRERPRRERTRRARIERPAAADEAPEAADEAPAADEEAPEAE
jgi:small subunit ribosomal protein S2